MLTNIKLGQNCIQKKHGKLFQKINKEDNLMMIIDVLYNVSVIRFLFNLYLPSGMKLSQIWRLDIKQGKQKKTI